MISLTALLAAIWVGLWFAGLFVAPIRRLISAAQQVATRQSHGRAADPPRRGRSAAPVDELQHHDAASWSASAPTLVTANSQLTERRRFMEAVLSGVSAGVHRPRPRRTHHACQPLGRAAARRSTRASWSASSSPRPCRSSRPCSTRRAEPSAQGARAAPGHAHHRRRGAHLCRARHARGRGRGRRRLGASPSTTSPSWSSAQRTSAWADVARRIAHEIKNPLTPIQLSAERIRRKYGKVITEDRETFDRCTETIIRQVGDVTPHGRRVLRLRAHAQAADGGCTTSARWCAPPCSIGRWRDSEIAFDDASPQASRSSSPATGA